jgi:hypothetical protein
MWCYVAEKSCRLNKGRERRAGLRPLLEVPDERLAPAEIRAVGRTRRLGVIAGLAVLWLVAARPAAAQFQTGFEPSDSYAGSDVGTILTEQSGWYVPPPTNVASFGDFSVFTYDGNALYLPANPAGATQFVGGQGLGAGILPAAQMDFDWSTQTQWTVEYDFAARFNGTLPAYDELGSFSLEPGGTIVGGNFIASNTWADRAGATTWNALYIVYDADGKQTTALSPGDDWTNLAVDNWYHQSTTFDLSLNMITSVSITDMTTGTTTTVSPEGWYLRPDVQPSALRFSVGAGGGSFPGNVMGFDNLSITPVAGN